MDCTVDQVLTKAMSVLGDPAGEITQEIFDDYSTAYGELYQCFMKITAQEIIREVYKYLPANTGVLFPQSLGVTDFGEPRQIWERGNIQIANIASLTDGTPIRITLTAPQPSWGTGSQIELNSIAGVPGWVNRDWFITQIDSLNFTLNGSVVCGSNGTGGMAMWSTDSFAPMSLADVMPLAGTQQLGTTLGQYRWDDNILYFPAANVPRQLWIEYLASGTAPASGVIGLCEGRELNFLGYATAAYFAPKRSLVQGPQVAMTAFGESGVADGSGGMMRSLLVPIIQQQQQRPMRSRMYRRRRTPFPFIA